MKQPYLVDLYVHTLVARPDGHHPALREWQRVIVHDQAQQRHVGAISQADGQGQGCGEEGGAVPGLGLGLELGLGLALALGLG